MLGVEVSSVMYSRKKLLSEFCSEVEVMLLVMLVSLKGLTGLH